jgi:hypothetical protein
MPVHDWTRVEAGIFHDFHHSWIEEIKRALNAGLLPEDYYALAEQFAAGFGPDVLTLQGPSSEPPGELDGAGPSGSQTGLMLAPPAVRLAGESNMEFYRRKQKVVAVRHVSGDRVVAVVEVVSPGNKAARNPLRSFVEKACELLDQRIHLLALDVLPPGRRDPQGIHGLIWEAITGEEYALPADRPLTMAAYESALTVRAFVEHVAVGNTLPSMPLFLEPGAHVVVPLETTYATAFSAVPLRWRRVLEGAST